MRRSDLALISVVVGAAAFGIATCDGCEDPPEQTSRGPEIRPRRMRTKGPLRGFAPSVEHTPAYDPEESIVEEDPDGSAPIDAGIERPVVDPILAELSERFCLPAARALCTALDRCGCDLEPRCIERQRVQCEGWLGCTYYPGPDRRFAIDPERLAACLSSLRALYQECSVEERPAECHYMLVDDVRAGETCTAEYSYLCLGGACVEGTCVRTPQIGDRCTYECAPGSYCEAESATCTRYEGSPCDGSCERPLACVNGVCTSPRREGQSCNAYECAPHLACIGNRCARSDECETDDECGRGDICLGSPLRRCRTLDRTRFVRMGQPCGGRQCELGAACRDGRCAPAPREGEACPDQLCADGLACRYHDTGLRCVDLHGECTLIGEVCAPERICVYDDAAQNVVCAPFGEENESCEERECGYYLYCMTLVENGRCAPALCQQHESQWYCDVD